MSPDKGHTSSLYLLAYYAGANVMGGSGGGAWRVEGWNGVFAYAAFVIVLGVACLLSKAEAAVRRRAI